MKTKAMLPRGLRAGLLMGLAACFTQAQMAAPVNDYFANRIALGSGSSITTSGSNVGAAKESGEPTIAGRIGGKSVWWSWTAPSAGTVTIKTTGSSFDTLLGVYTGSSVSALTTVASNDDDPSGGMLTSRVNFN